MYCANHYVTSQTRQMNPTTSSPIFSILVRTSKANSGFWVKKVSKTLALWTHTPLNKTKVPLVLFYLPLYSFHLFSHVCVFSTCIYVPYLSLLYFLYLSIFSSVFFITVPLSLWTCSISLSITLYLCSIHLWFVCFCLFPVGGETNLAERWTRLEVCGAAIPVVTTNGWGLKLWGHCIRCVQPNMAAIAFQATAWETLARNEEKEMLLLRHIWVNTYIRLWIFSRIF